MRDRSILAGVVFGILLLAAFDPRPLLRIPEKAAVDRVPRYTRFLTEVASRTAPGQSIAIAAPARSWNRGYSYVYYRASYLLAGRRVIPLIDPDEQMHFERMEKADLVAAWEIGPPHGPYQMIWSGHGGALYRRTR